MAAFTNKVSGKYSNMLMLLTYCMQVSDFIVTGRLNAKIDKVANVIETAPSFERTAQYQALIKEGDLLLNRLQKLSKIVDVE
jgi:26S proteasome regulatory subunit N7